MAIQCSCGGTLVFRSGVSHKYGKPRSYQMWSCNKFPACQAKPLTVEEYNALLNSGKKEAKAVIEKKIWIKPDYTPRNPIQKNNKKSLVSIPYTTLTHEQEAAIEAVLAGLKAIKVDADAGVGKTTLCKQIAARTSRKAGEITTGIIMAFSSRPSKELKAELADNWTSATVHSVGNDAVCGAYGLNPMGQNKRKTSQILRTEYGNPENPVRQAFYNSVAGLVSMCKALALNETVDDKTLLEKAHHYNKPVAGDEGEIIAMVKNVLKLSHSESGLRDYGHDFDDMVWLPIVNNLQVARYRHVLVDEAQDSSIARMKLAIMSLAPNGQLLFVGDKDQAIFGFTCADTSSMETFSSFINPVSFPVTINWRCPSIVLELTRIIHPSIKARPNAPLGAIHIITDDDLNLIASPGDVVLSRINANLIRVAYRLIKQHIGAVILGRDIGESFKDLIEKLARNPDKSLCSTTEMLRRAGEWYSSEYDAVEGKNLRNPDFAYDELFDTYECLLALCGAEIVNGALSGVDVYTIPDLYKKIDRLFGEEDDIGFNPKKVVMLSTVHKFKGGQAARIFLLDAAELHPHPAATSEWELQQESNILYVAITRTGDGTANPKQALFFVNGIPQALESGSHLLTEYTGVKR